MWRYKVIESEKQAVSICSNLMGTVGFGSNFLLDKIDDDVLWGKRWT